MSMRTGKDEINSLKKPGSTLGCSVIDDNDEKNLLKYQIQIENITTSS